MKSLMLSGFCASTNCFVHRWLSAKDQLSFVEGDSIDDKQRTFLCSCWSIGIQSSIHENDPFQFCMNWALKCTWYGFGGTDEIVCETVSELLEFNKKK